MIKPQLGRHYGDQGARGARGEALPRRLRGSPARPAPRPPSGPIRRRSQDPHQTNPIRDIFEVAVPDWGIIGALFRPEVEAEAEPDGGLELEGRRDPVRQPRQGHRERHSGTAPTTTTPSLIGELQVELNPLSSPLNTF